jgi:replicative DNA helicase
MALTDSNVLKLAPDAGTPVYRSAPHNIEAEQSLLGAILVNNDAFYRVSDFLERSTSSSRSTRPFSRPPAA